MNIELPNGVVLEDIPEGTSRDVIKRKVYAKYPELNPENNKQSSDKGGWESVLEDALSGAKEVPSSLWQSAKELPGQAQQVALQSLLNPARLGANAIRGFDIGLRGMMNTPSNIANYLKSKGIGEGAIEDYIGKWNVPTQMTDFEKKIYDQTSQQNPFYNEQKADTGAQGASSFFPYMAIPGSKLSGVRGLLTRSGVAGAQAIGQNENPITQMLMAGGSEIIPKAIAKGGSAAVNKFSPSNLLRGNLSAEELGERLRASKGTNIPLGNVLDSDSLRNIHALTSEVPFSGGEKLAEQLQNQITKKAETALQSTQPENFINDPNYLSDKLLEGIMAPHIKEAESINKIIQQEYDEKNSNIEDINKNTQQNYDLKQQRLEDQNISKKENYEKELEEQKGITSNQKDVMDRIKSEEFTSEPENMVQGIIKNMEDPLKKESESILKSIEPQDTSTDPNLVVKKILTSVYEAQEKNNSKIYKNRNEIATKENFRPEITEFREELGKSRDKILDVLSSELGLNSENDFGLTEYGRDSVYGGKTYSPINLSKAQQIASDIYKESNNYISSINPKERSIGKGLRKLSLSLKNDIKRSIENNGSKELKSAQFEADENYKKNIVPFLDKDVHELLDKNEGYDTVINDIIKAGKNDEFSNIEKVMNLLPEKDKKLLGYAYLQKAVDKSGNIDHVELHKLIKKLGNRQFKTLFTDKDFRERLLNFSKLKEDTENTEIYKLFKKNKDPDTIITDIIKPNTGVYSGIKRFQKLLSEDKQDFLGISYLKGAVNKFGELDTNLLSKKLDALSTDQFNLLYKNKELRNQLANFKESKKKIISEPLYKILNPQGGEILLKSLPSDPKRYTYEKPFINKTPEKLAHEIINPNKLNKSYDYVDNINNANNLLPKEQENLIGHLYLRNALNETNKLSPEKLYNFIDAMGENQIKESFKGKDLVQSLMDFKKFYEISKKSGNKDSLKYLAKSFPLIFGAGGAAFGPVSGSAAALVSLYAVPKIAKGINKYLTSEPIREKLINKMIENSNKKQSKLPSSNDFSGLFKKALISASQKSKNQQEQTK